MASLSVSQVPCKVTIGSDFVTGISRRMRGICEGYLFPGIFTHQLLPDRRRFGFGRISFIALAKDIEKASKKDDDDGWKNDSNCVLLSGTHKIISRSHGLARPIVAAMINRNARDSRTRSPGGRR
jgi:hypothetical protein